MHYYYLKGKIKDTVYVNSSHSCQDLEVNMQREIAAFSIQEFYHMGRNIFGRYKAYLKAGSRHFKTVL
jgi:hypothetical protein